MGSEVASGFNDDTVFEGDDLRGFDDPPPRRGESPDDEPLLPFGPFLPPSSIEGRDFDQNDGPLPRFD